MAFGNDLVSSFDRVHCRSRPPCLVEVNKVLVPRGVDADAMEATLGSRIVSRAVQGEQSLPYRSEIGINQLEVLASLLPIL